MKLQRTKLKEIISQEIKQVLKEMDFSYLDDLGPEEEAPRNQEEISRNLESVINEKIGQNTVSFMSQHGDRTVFSFDIDKFREFIKNFLEDKGFVVNFVAIDEVDDQMVLEVSVK